MTDESYGSPFDKGKLAKALADAQAEFGPVVKSTVNPVYGSKYADLSVVIAATQPVLAKHGLVVVQMPVTDVVNRQAGVKTLLIHESGQVCESQFMLPATMLGKGGVDRFDAQSIGSAITYSRRYAYQAIIGVAAEVDDDANKISGVGTVEAQQAVAQQKIAAKAAAQETIFLAPDGDMVYLSGHGLSILRSAATNEAQGKVGLVQLSKGWAIPVTLVVPFTSLCAEHKVAVHLAEQASPPRAESRSDSTPKVGTGPGVVKWAGTAPGNIISNLVSKSVKVRGQPQKQLVITWKGMECSVAPWLQGLFGLLTEAYTKSTPINLLIATTSKGDREFHNVTGVEGAEKGDDGVYRFARQLRDDVPPPIDGDYIAVDEDIPL